MHRAIRRANERLQERSSPYRSVSWAVLALAAFATSGSGCASTPKADGGSGTTGTSSSKSTAATSGATVEPKPASAKGPQRLEANRTAKSAGTNAPAADPTSTLINPGDEVDGNVGSDRVPSAARTRAARDSGSMPATDTRTLREPTPEDVAAAKRLAASRPKTTRAGAAGAGAAVAPEDERPTWGVMLATFAGEDHRATAMTARDEIARRFPAVADCYVRTTTRGSVVLVGRFEGPQEAAAQAELKRVKEIQSNGQRVFGRAILTRVGASADLSPPGPHDLRSVRAQAPKATMYTLQVAVWSALGTDELKMSEIKRAAEAYCRELRTQGNEAYYFHDFDTRTSVVTVGVFGPDAYDSKSTLYAPDVEAVMRKFPKHLVNGEELRIPVDPRNPAGKTIPQSPRLVEVPKL
jgi:hypothetical protein